MVGCPDNSRRINSQSSWASFLQIPAAINTVRLQSMVCNHWSNTSVVWQTSCSQLDRCAFYANNITQTASIDQSWHQPHHALSTCSRRRMQYVCTRIAAALQQRFSWQQQQQTTHYCWLGHCQQCRGQMAATQHCWQMLTSKLYTVGNTCKAIHRSWTTCLDWAWCLATPWVTFLWASALHRWRVALSGTGWGWGAAGCWQHPPPWSLSSRSTPSSWLCPDSPSEPAYEIFRAEDFVIGFSFCSAALTWLCLHVFPEPADWEGLLLSVQLSVCCYVQHLQADCAWIVLQNLPTWRW